MLRVLHSVARGRINAAIETSVCIPLLCLRECNSSKCSKPQHISDDVKLSEPGGGGSILTGAITEKLSHFLGIKKDLETVIQTFKV